MALPSGSGLLSTSAQDRDLAVTGPQHCSPGPSRCAPRVIEKNRLVLRSSVKLKSMFHTSTLTAALLMEEENLAIWALTLECVDWAGLAEGELSIRGLG